MSEPVTLKDGRRVVIREATLDDAPAMRAYVEELAETAPYIGMNPGETPSTPEVVERIESMAKLPGSLALIAQSEDEPGVVVGDCQLKAYPRQKLRHVALIGMGLREPWRGVGLGRALLGRVVEHARASEHLWRIELSVTPENPGAVALYESLGFEREGLQRGRFRQPDGTLLDDLVMGLWVGPEDQRPR